MHVVLKPILVCAALAACAPVVVDPGDQPGTCGAEAWSSYIGAPSSSLDAVRFRQPVRVIPAGAPITMDFNPDRLNFELDTRGRISRVYCG